MASRFREHYDNVVRGELQKQFNYKNLMQVPKVKKIVVNMGVGDRRQQGDFGRGRRHDRDYRPQADRHSRQTFGVGLQTA